MRSGHPGAAPLGVRLVWAPRQIQIVRRLGRRIAGVEDEGDDCGLVEIFSQLITPVSGTGEGNGRRVVGNGPADPKQTGGNEIVGTHPCPEAPLDIALYRKLYAPVNQVTS